MTLTILDHPPRLRFAVRVQPRSSRTRVVGALGDALKVQLAAPPVDGAANEALVSLLAGALDVARARVSIVAGLHSRRKTVEVGAADVEALRRRLEILAQSAKT